MPLDGLAIEECVVYIDDYISPRHVSTYIYIYIFIDCTDLTGGRGFSENENRFVNCAFCRYDDNCERIASDDVRRLLRRAVL